MLNAPGTKINIQQKVQKDTFTSVRAFSLPGCQRGKRTPRKEKRNHQKCVAEETQRGLFWKHRTDPLCFPPVLHSLSVTTPPLNCFPRRLHCFDSAAMPALASSFKSYPVAATAACERRHSTRSSQAAQHSPARRPALLQEQSCRQELHELALLPADHPGED